MEPEVSEDFLTFLRSMDDTSSRAAMESYDTWALSQLKGDELDAAKLALVQNLQQHVEDPRTPQAIRDMKFVDLVPELRKAVDTYPNNYTRVAAADALWTLARDQAAIDALVDAAAGAPEREMRILATSALSHLNGESVDLFLVEVLVRDADKLVRVAAESMVWERNGVAQLKAAPPPDLADAARRLKSKTPEARRQAVDDFHAAARKARAQG
jgi:HEAT repeats